jgi:hypothetical protein
MACCACCAEACAACCASTCVLSLLPQLLLAHPPASEGTPQCASAHTCTHNASTQRQRQQQQQEVSNSLARLGLLPTPRPRFVRRTDLGRQLCLTQGPCKQSCKQAGRKSKTHMTWTDGQKKGVTAVLLLQPLLSSSQWCVSHLAIHLSCIHRPQLLLVACADVSTTL